MFNYKPRFPNQSFCGLINHSFIILKLWERVKKKLEMFLCSMNKQRSNKCCDSMNFKSKYSANLQILLFGEINDNHWFIECCVCCVGNILGFFNFNWNPTSIWFSRVNYPLPTKSSTQIIPLETMHLKLG